MEFDRTFTLLARQQQIRINSLFPNSVIQCKVMFQGSNFEPTFRDLSNIGFLLESLTEEPRKRTDIHEDVLRL